MSDASSGAAAADAPASGPAAAHSAHSGPGDAAKTAAGTVHGWRVLVQPRWLAWHLFAVIAVVGMAWLGDWQFRRALNGNGLSWAYTFEWPIFAVFGVVFWIKTIRDELVPDRGGGKTEAIKFPAGIGLRSTHQTDAELTDAELADAEPTDTELAEYNAYLARLSEETRGHGKWHGLR